MGFRRQKKDESVLVRACMCVFDANKLQVAPFWLVEMKAELMFKYRWINATHTHTAISTLSHVLHMSKPYDCQSHFQLMSLDFHVLCMCVLCMLQDFQTLFSFSYFQNATRQKLVLNGVFSPTGDSSSNYTFGVWNLNVSVCQQSEQRV